MEQSRSLQATMVMIGGFHVKMEQFKIVILSP